MRNTSNYLNIGQIRWKIFKKNMTYNCEGDSANLANMRVAWHVKCSAAKKFSISCSPFFHIVSVCTAQTQTGYSKYEHSGLHD